MPTERELETQRILKEADKVLRRVLKILIIQSDMLRARGLPPQRVYDLRRGQVLIKGIYVPLSSIEHRILLDGFEVNFINNFIDLYKSLYKNRKNSITQFALRTCVEMGFQRCQILFSALSKEEIESYKLVAMLGDYGFMALGRPEHVRTFERLLAESNNLLTDKQKALFAEYIASVKSNDTELHAKLTKKTRKLADSVQDALYKKTPIHPLLRINVINALFSSFSHILHGNALLLIDTFSNRRPNQLLLRVYWVLLLTGFNMVNHISEHLKDSKIKARVKRLNKTFESVTRVIQANWAAM